VRNDPARWRGCVVAWRGGPCEPPEEHLAAGPWVLFGDPTELDRIAAGLGLPR
jgi:hypothetical protein